MRPRKTEPLTEQIMFRCYFCQQITPPKTTRHSVVIETREKKYSTRRREPKRGGFRNRDDSVQDRGGQGMEIMKEVDACPECAAKQGKPKVIGVESPASPESNSASATE